MKDRIFSQLQKIGKTFMLPISLLPIAGLFLGIGASFTGDTFIKMYNLQGILSKGTPLNKFLSVLNDCGSVVFDNLGLLFAISIAIGLAKSEKGVAALSAVVGYFLMYASLTSSIKNFRNLDELNNIEGLITSVVGFKNTMDLGVFGGIVIGLVIAGLHNRYYKIKLPDVLSFFGGTHFIPIISAIAGLAVGIIFSFIWPYFAAGIAAFGAVIAESGSIGSFLYGYIYRMLIPFGLHHIFYLPFWQTAVGGTAEVAGHTVVGAQNIVFAQLSAGDTISYEAARFFSFQFPEMIFGLPAAALAMYTVAKKDKKKDVKGLLFSSSITGILTGITEPLEFTILFASPLLYFGVHCVLFAQSAVFVTLLKIGVGFTFSGGLIDFILYGVLPGNARTNWIPVVFLGIAYFILYYFVFRFVIKKFNLNTPGRNEDTKLHTKQDYLESTNYTKLTDDEKQAYNIVSSLGGTNNIIDVDNCATRLRVSVKDNTLVDRQQLSSTGTAGIVIKGSGVQAVYGTKVSNIKLNVTELIDTNKAPKIRTSEPKETPTKTKKPQESTGNTSTTKNASVSLYALASGDLKKITEVNDDAFSNKLLGDGFAIVPSEGKVYAPINGEVTNVFPTKHAIGIIDENNIEYLIHMGIDTVDLQGHGFKTFVQPNQKVEPGDLLAEMDLNYITSQNKITDIIFVVLTQELIDSLEMNDTKKVNANEIIGKIDLK